MEVLCWFQFPTSLNVCITVLSYFKSNRNIWRRPALGTVLKQKPKLEAPVGVACLTEVTFCSLIRDCMKALTRPPTCDIPGGDLQSALMLVKYSPPPPASRQLDSSRRIYTKCSNYSRKVLWVRSIMIQHRRWQLPVFFASQISLCPLVLFSSHL